MQKLDRAQLFSLEQYAEKRPDFRARVIAHKKPRKVLLGDHVSLHFEDRMTIQYQIQEMLRVERIFEAEGIQEELDAYNPLIPDGQNLKATMLIEYAEVDERKQALARMIGIEDRVCVQIAGFEPAFAIADEDLERENDEKTSSVHFLRFEFDPAMISALKQGATLHMGIDYPNYNVALVPVSEETRLALLADFD